MNVKLLTEYHFEFLSLKEGCTGSSESTHVKIPHCWKSLVDAHLYVLGSTYGTCTKSLFKHASSASQWNFGQSINLLPYSKTCLKWPLKNNQYKGLKDKW